MSEGMKYKGMTVNERLYVSGLMDKFDEAVKNRDINEVTSILEKVGLRKESIAPILERYGLTNNQEY